MEKPCAENCLVYLGSYCELPGFNSFILDLVDGFCKTLGSLIGYGIAVSVDDMTLYIMTICKLKHSDSDHLLFIIRLCMLREFRGFRKKEKIQRRDFTQSLTFRGRVLSIDSA